MRRLSRGRRGGPWPYWGAEARAIALECVTTLQRSLPVVRLYLTTAHTILPQLASDMQRLVTTAVSAELVVAVAETAAARITRLNASVNDDDPVRAATEALTATGRIELVMRQLDAVPTSRGADAWPRHARATQRALIDNAEDLGTMLLVPANVLRATDQQVASLNEQFSSWRELPPLMVSRIAQSQIAPLADLVRGANGTGTALRNLSDAEFFVTEIANILTTIQIESKGGNTSALDLLM